MVTWAGGRFEFDNSGSRAKVFRASASTWRATPHRHPTSRASLRGRLRPHASWFLRRYRFWGSPSCATRKRGTAQGRSSDARNRTKLLAENRDFHVVVGLWARTRFHSWVFEPRICAQQRCSFSRNRISLGGYPLTSCGGRLSCEIGAGGKGRGFPIGSVLSSASTLFRKARFRHRTDVSIIRTVRALSDHWKANRDDRLRWRLSSFLHGGERSP